MKLYQLTDANLFVLVVDVTRRTVANVLVMILDIMLAVTGRSRCGVSAKRLAMVATQVVDAHFHSVNARVETLGALVDICDKLHDHVPTTRPQIKQNSTQSFTKHGPQAVHAND